MNARRRRGAGLDALVAATPADRDRVVDFLRAASILAVVAGHWLIATVVRDGDDLRGTNALAAMPWLRLLTWIFQVMPVFFVVGGFANQRSLEAGGGRDTGRFLAGRAERLLRPTLPFVVAWLVVGPLLVEVWGEPRLAADVARIAAQPLWFLAVYVLVVLAAPVQLRLHRRHGRATLACLVVVVVAFDALRLSDVAPGPAVVNYLAVFLFSQGLGFAYADGRFAAVRPRTALAVSGVALGALAALTTVGPYPVSMIGLPGQRISNMSPPTLVILVLGVAQAALLLAAHDALARWLERPRAWRATIVANLAVLTTFLWHLTALIIAGAVLLSFGLPVVEPGSAAWWLERPLWLGTAVVVLVALVLAFSPVERRAVTPPVPGHVPRRVGGALTAVMGLTGLALVGFARPFEAGHRSLLGVHPVPALAGALLLVGWLAARGPTTGATARGRGRHVGRDEVPPPGRRNASEEGPRGGPGRI